MLKETVDPLNTYIAGQGFDFYHSMFRIYAQIRSAGSEASTCQETLLVKPKLDRVCVLNLVPLDSQLADILKDASKAERDDNLTRWDLDAPEIVVYFTFDPHECQLAVYCPIEGKPVTRCKRVQLGRLPLSSFRPAEVPICTIQRGRPEIHIHVFSGQDIPKPTHPTIVMRWQEK